MCVLNFSTIFVRKISHSEKHPARYKYCQIRRYHMHRTKSGTFCTNRSRRTANLLPCSYDMRDGTFSQTCPKDSSLLGCDAMLFGKWFRYFEGSYCIHLQDLQSENTKVLHSLEPPRTITAQTQCHILKSMTMRAGTISYNCQTFYCVHNTCVTTVHQYTTIPCIQVKTRQRQWALASYTINMATQMTFLCEQLLKWFSAALTVGGGGHILTDVLLTDQAECCIR
jgi:hypothetical protein